MSHIALYRKKRPRTWEEVVGQPHIVRALVNQLKSGQVSHAYLFCGTRGTGKTSAAKIFARAVNCLAPVNGAPCNECELCAAILAERCLDVTEIDAASNNGVDNIRDLRDEVKFLPTQGKFKVYIVDEVHMLSGSAFNALLKTLEEPPSHVIFILATTDPQKIPATILSRCQRYDFRRISTPDMVATLKKYLGDTPFEDAALDYIAYHSDGAMRDALSLLDQCLSLEDGLTLTRLREMLGAVDKLVLSDFTAALAAQDSAKVIEIISRAMDDGRDVSQFAADLIRHFRDILVDGLTTGKELYPAATLMRYITAFSEALRELKFAPHMRTAFEVCALRLCANGAGSAGDGGEPEVAPTPPAPDLSTKSSKTDTPSNIAVPQPFSKSSKSSATSNSSPASLIIPRWGKFCATLPRSWGSFAARCGVEEENGMITLICGDTASKAILEQKTTDIREKIEDFYRLSPPPNLAIVVQAGYNKKEEIPEAPPEEPTVHIPDDWASFGQEVIEGEEF
jgi:DNA polymerase III subunit gamma/tau